MLPSPYSLRTTPDLCTHSYIRELLVQELVFRRTLVHEKTIYCVFLGREEECIAESRVTVVPSTGANCMIYSSSLSIASHNKLLSHTSFHN